MEIPLTPQCNTRNIALLGFSGTGKSTIAAILADQLHFDRIDTDAHIERIYGRTIADLFAERGEAFFRRTEHAVVCAMAGKTNVVIACGGGVVTDPRNIVNLSKNGLLICLTADPEIAWKRIANSTARPLINSKHDMHKLWTERQDMYATIPHQIDTSSLSPLDVAREIMTIYLMLCQKTPPSLVVGMNGLV